MIEIRLVKGYDKSQLKFLLERINKVAPKELTYSLGEIEDVDVNIGDRNSATLADDYKRISIRFPDDLWVVVYQVGYIAYYQGESYSGESLDEIIYDMFE